MNQRTDSIWDAPLAQKVLRMPRTVMVLFVVCLTTLGVFAVNWGQFQSEAVASPLFGQCELTVGELKQIEMALYKAGKHDFDVRDRKIFVPEEHRSEVLEVLEQANVMPSCEVPQWSSAQGNILLAPSQQAELALSARKSKVQQALTRLPYIDQVWFEMNVAPGETAFSPDRRSANVQLSLKEQERLTSQRIVAVCQTITGHFASLDPEKIVITDLSTGRTFHGAPAEEVSEGVTDLELIDWEAGLNQRIAAALQPYHGISFQLDYRPRVAPIHRNGQDRVAELPKVFRKASDQQVMKGGDFEQAYGANQRLSIEPSAPTQLASNTPLPFATSSDRKRRLAEPEIGVRVEIHPSALAAENNSIDLASHSDWEARVTELQQTITSKIHEVVPESIGAAGTSIEFQLPDLTELGTARKESSNFPVQWEKLNWTSTVMVLGVGLIFLTMVLTIQTAKEPTETISEGNAVLPVDNPEETERRRSAEQRLSRLIDSDPEAAAQVLKSWIQDGT